MTLALLLLSPRLDYFALLFVPLSLARDLYDSVTQSLYNLTLYAEAASRQLATDDKVFPAIKAGALGYLLKDSGPEALVNAIHQVHRGEPSLHPKIARMMLQELGRPAAQPPTTDPLTAREGDVLVVARGLSNQEIADELVISKATVRTHVSRILNKLHLASRTQAALYALRAGLASLDD